MRNQICKISSTIILTVLVGCKSIQRSNLANNQVQRTSEYIVLDRPSVELSSFEKDKDGYFWLFDGKTWKGWRGYGREDIPSRWIIEDGTMSLKGKETQGSRNEDGGGYLICT